MQLTNTQSATYNDGVIRQFSIMAVVWGVEAMLIDYHTTTDDVMENATDTFCKAGRLKKGDLIIFTAGVPVGKVGSTNLIMTQVIKHD